MSPISPPILYRQSLTAAVLYAISYDQAQSLLADTGLFALRLGGYGIVNVAWFDYGASTIGAYREFSLGVMAATTKVTIGSAAQLLRGRSEHLGAFVVALPVDSEVACRGGVALYGLPKTVVRFELDWQASWLKASLHDQETHILSMRVPIGKGFPIPMKRLTLFSVLDGQLLTTEVATDWSMRIAWGGRPQLSLGERSHPLSKLVDSIGLETARALVTLHGPLHHARLDAPRVIRGCSRLALQTP
jgi:hypothetical protein